MTADEPKLLLNVLLQLLSCSVVVLDLKGDLALLRSAREEAERTELPLSSNLDDGDEPKTGL